MEEMTSVDHHMGDSAPEDEGFSYPEFEQQVELLRYLIDNGDRIALVRGKAGAGKSTLARRVAGLEPPGWVLCGIDGNPMLQAEQLFEQLGRGFATAMGVGDPLETLRQRLDRLRQEGGRPVVLVDDAHLLPVETLVGLFRMSALQIKGRPLVNIALFASAEFDAQLGAPQMQTLAPQTIQTIELQPMTSDQTVSYIKHLLRARSRVQEDVGLSQSRLERIYRESGGVPGAIRDCLDQLLEQCVEADSVEEDPEEHRSLLFDLPLLAIVGVVVIVVMLLLTLVFEDQINALFADTDAREDGGVRVIEAPEQVVPLALPGEPQDPDPAGDVGVVEEPEPVMALPQRVAVLGLAQGGEPPAGAPMAGKTAVVEAVAPSRAETPDEAAGAETVVPAATPMRPQSDPLGQRQKQSEAESLVNEPAANKPPRKSTTVISERVEAAAPSGAPVVNATGGAAPTPRDEAWLLSRPAGAYTLQLIGVSNRLSAENFIDLHRLRGAALLLPLTVKGRPWYAVLLGSYPTRQAALAAQGKLPAALRGAGVWPRPIDSLRQARADR